MAKAIAKVKSGKATPEYRTGATRMYGTKRVPPAVKKVAKKKSASTYDPTVWKFFTDPMMSGMNKAMTTTGNVVKKAGKGYIAYTKAVTVDAPKNIKKVIALRNKKAPQLRKRAK